MTICSVTNKNQVLAAFSKTSEYLTAPLTEVAELVEYGNATLRKLALAAGERNGCRVRRIIYYRNVGWRGEVNNLCIEIRKSPHRWVLENVKLSRASTSDEEHERPRHTNSFYGLLRLVTA